MMMLAPVVVGVVEAGPEVAWVAAMTGTGSRCPCRRAGEAWPAEATGTGSFPGGVWAGTKGRCVGEGAMRTCPLRHVGAPQATAQLLAWGAAEGPLAQQGQGQEGTGRATGPQAGQAAMQAAAAWEAVAALAGVDWTLTCQVGAGPLPGGAPPRPLLLA